MSIAQELYIQPAEIVEVDGPVIFLAGPIQGAPLWQPEAAALIHAQTEIIVASPQKDYPEGTFVYENQVDWETHFLRRAAKCGVIMFWLAAQTEETPGRSYAQTSRFELGEAKLKHERDGINLVVGIESGFGNERYIRRRFNQDCPDVLMPSNLAETVSSTLELVNSLD
ncbi:MAG: hypothetical protein ACREF7_04450 [Candidatus Saccharimonadales bacterium]